MTTLWTLLLLLLLYYYCVFLFRRMSMRDNRACHAPTNVPDLVCTRGGKPPTAFWFVSVGNKHSTFIHSFIHFCHAPLWVRSAKRTHHSPDWTFLSHVSCFVQGEVSDSRSCWVVFIHVVRGLPDSLLQFSSCETVKTCFKCQISGISCQCWSLMLY